MLTKCVTNLEHIYFKFEFFFLVFRNGHTFYCSQLPRPEMSSFVNLSIGAATDLFDPLEDPCRILQLGQIDIIQTTRHFLNKIINV